MLTEGGMRDVTAALADSWAVSRLPGSGQSSVSSNGHNGHRQDIAGWQADGQAQGTHNRVTGRLYIFRLWINETNINKSENKLI